MTTICIEDEDNDLRPACGVLAAFAVAMVMWAVIVSALLLVL